MRSWPGSLALILLIAILGCEEGMSAGDGPTFTDSLLRYTPHGGYVYGQVLASHPDGPSEIECQWSVNGASVLDTSATDTLWLEFPLVDHPRLAPVTSTLSCTAAHDGAESSLTLTLDTAAVDSAPTFDTLLVRTYVQPIDSPPWTIGIYIDVRDDWELKRFTIELSDSAACPCHTPRTTDVNSIGWWGSIFSFYYDAPGTYYVHVVAEDDVGQTVERWRGPMQLPIPATAPLPDVVIPGQRPERPPTQ